MYWSFTLRNNRKNRPIYVNTVIVLITLIAGVDMLKRFK